jgi:hypothetical protein
MLHLESCSCNKSYPSPTACCFPKIVDKKPFLVCFKFLLHYLSSTYMLSTPTKHTSWFTSNIKSYHAGSTNIYPIALLGLAYHWFRVSTLHGVGPLLSHVVMISLVPSCICHIQVSKGMTSSTVPKINSIWKFLPQWRMSSLTLELENVISHFEYLTRVAGPRRLSIEAQNKQSQEAQSDSTRCHVAHARKKKLYERPRSFPPSNYLNILLSPRPMWHSSFLVLPTSFHKSRDEISFKGGGGV